MDFKNLHFEGKIVHKAFHVLGAKRCSRSNNCNGQVHILTPLSLSLKQIGNQRPSNGCIVSVTSVENIDQISIFNTVVASQWDNKWGFGSPSMGGCSVSKPPRTQPRCCEMLRESLRRFVNLVSHFLRCFISYWWESLLSTVANSSRFASHCTRYLWSFWHKKSWLTNITFYLSMTLILGSLF